MTKVQKELAAQPPQHMVSDLQHAEHAPRTLTEAMDRAKWIIRESLAEQVGAYPGRPIMNDQIAKTAGDRSAENEVQVEDEGVSLYVGDDAAEHDADKFAESDREMTQRKSNIMRRA